MDTNDVALPTNLSGLASKTITGRPFLESGPIGILCFRLPTEGFFSLAQTFGLSGFDEKSVLLHLRAVVAWYRTTGWPGFWTNEALFEWFESQSMIRDERQYSMYAAMLLCVDRAVVCGMRDRMQEAEQWFDCAQWLRFSLASGAQVGADERIKEVLTTLSRNLDEGRRKGAESQKEYAAETWRLVEERHKQFLKRPDYAGWKPGQRATYLAGLMLADPDINEPLKGRNQPNGNPYEASTIQKRLAKMG